MSVNSDACDRYVALVDTIRATCWSAGLEAPATWVHWLLDLQLVSDARLVGTSIASATLAMSFDAAEQIGEELVDECRWQGSIDGLRAPKQT